MADLLALAPEGMSDALMSVAVPMVAAGFGLVLLLWPIGALWRVVMSMFDL